MGQLGKNWRDSTESGLRTPIDAEGMEDLEARAAADIAAIPLKPSVPTTAALPPLGNTIGDMRLVLSDMALYGWSGSRWGGVQTGASMLGDFITVPTIGTRENAERLVWVAAQAAFDSVAA